MIVNQRGAKADGDVVAGDKITYYIGNQALADKEIQQKLNFLRSRRWFVGDDRFDEARHLAHLCTDGMLAGGSSGARSVALAWCARILSSSEDPSEADQLLAAAKQLGSGEEPRIAEAFTVSKREGMPAALTMLGGIDTPSSRAASFLIVAHHEGSAKALEWFSSAGLTPEHLDAEGKSLLIVNQLKEGDWDLAISTARQCNENDIAENPLMCFHFALTELLSIVPEEDRRLIFTQPPFEMREFELASDSTSLESHAKSYALFEQSAKQFEQFGLSKEAKIANEYALWLGLEHPELRVDSRKRLRDGLADPKLSLGLVRFALQYGVDLNIKAVEEDIARQVTLSGGPKVDTALARFSIALTQSSRAEVAKYIARYRDELIPHINPLTLGFIEIEMLAESGQTDLAQIVFDKLLQNEGLCENDKASLELIMSESAEDDPISTHRKQYETSRFLMDLRVLVNILEQKEEWEQLSIYAADLFSKTKSQSAAEKLVASLVKT